MVNLGPAQAMSLLRQADHAVLGTLHPTRGVDLVPVVFAVDDHDHLGVPIDRVKPKSGTRLRREDNLAADPRGTLLVQRWDQDDWSRLFWVRAQLRWQGVDHGCEEALADLLADRYPQYRDRPFDRVLVFQIGAIAGWSAGPSAGAPDATVFEAGHPHHSGATAGQLGRDARCPPST